MNVVSAENGPAVQNLPLEGLDELRKAAKYASGWAGVFEQHLGHLIGNMVHVANSPVAQAVAEVVLPPEIEQLLVQLIRFHGKRPDQVQPSEPAPAGPIEAAARQAAVDPTPHGSDTSSPPAGPVTDPFYNSPGHG